MSRAIKKSVALPFGIAVLAAVVFSGCGGGGGGGGGSGNGTLIAVSFLGYTPAPPIGINPTVPLPTVFRDQALEFKFDRAMDDPIFGGFFSQAGVPVVFGGVPPAGTNPIPYYAFSDQFAAHNALQIYENPPVPGPAVPLASYIVGRHTTKLDTLVLDPRVPAGNPLGLPINPGFKSQQQYVFIIPAGSGLLFNGQSAQPAGPSIFALPVIVPPFTTQPLLSGLFLSGGSFGPDPVPPAILSIAPQSGNAGTAANPMLAADPIVITFSKNVTQASLDQLKNVIIRNLNVTNSTFPQGVLVPGSLDFANPGPGVTADFQYIFTPASPYGPGTMGHGFDIEVRVGDIPYPQPNNVVPPILGVPTGLSGTQLELSNSLSVTLRAAPCTGCATPVSIVEGFDTSAQRDTTFIQTMGQPGLNNQARWSDSTAPSQLAGRNITGSPAGNTPAALGTRFQTTIDPTPNNTSPAGLFSPFDSSAANSGGQCGTQGCWLTGSGNSMGGNHIMHIYEFGEGTPPMNQRESLEQIEWSPVGGVVAQSVYPMYSIWCGLTNTMAPFVGGSNPGLTSVFDTNYNLTPYQTGTALVGPCANTTATNPRKVNCGLNGTYTTNLSTTQFYPFPLLTPPFDYARSNGMLSGGTDPTNLLYEVNIEPGNQVPNFNRYRANAMQPVRRLLDKPLSAVPINQCAFNSGGGQFDIYRIRFTFVNVVSQARSLWYNTGSPDPDYLNFIVSPPVTAQPVGSTSTFILEATDAVSPTPTTTPAASAVYIDAAGVHPQVLGVGPGMIGHFQHFRFKVEFRANNVTNGFPAYTSVTMAYTIP